MALTKVLALQDQLGMPEAIGRVVTDSLGKVCSVCGLERMGHAPESQWLGYEYHNWQPVSATPAMVKRAHELSAQGYRERLSAPRPCGHYWTSAACNRGKCVHVAGHCSQCS